MLFYVFRSLSPLSRRFSAGKRGTMPLAVLCIAIVSIVFASCGSSTTAVNAAHSPAPTHTVVITPTPQFTPTLTPPPTPKPKPTPTPAPKATPPPVQTAPAILDLRPLSMSIVGHLDCQKNGAYICLARVLSRSSNQSDLHWFASTNVPGRIFFSPASGVLAPGQSVLVTITVPFTACTPGLFIFRGPINTHTITWAC